VAKVGPGQRVLFLELLTPWVTGENWIAVLKREILTDFHDQAHQETGYSKRRLRENAG
jgi:hypothetical protein